MNAAIASTSAPNFGQSPVCSSGPSASGRSSWPWIAFEVSQAMQTLQPIAFSRSRCGWIARFSSSTERVSRLSEYQPETNFSPCGSSAAFSATGSVGNLWPFSMPSKPISAVSARHCSSGMSAPRVWSSSFDQAMGLVP